MQTEAASLSIAGMQAIIANTSAVSTQYNAYHFY